MERGMSDEIEARMMAVLGNPRTCPHGNPIPQGDFNTVEYLREQHAIRLSAAPTGVETRVVLISEVVEDETALLLHLGELKIMPGARLTVLEHEDGAGTLPVRIVPRGEGGTPQEVSLDRDLAAKIWVRPLR
jgi:DtxR family Mn-dependent transcriptional regulator